MKEKSKKSTFIIIGVLCGLIVCLSVAFATLSATLYVNFGNVTQNQLTWAVAFDTTGSPKSATAGGTSATGRTCGTATLAATQVTIGDTQLSKPGDKCTWALTVKNTGGIDATLASVTPSAPTGVSCTPSGASTVCGNITYKLTTDAAGSTLLTTGGTLAKSTGTQNMYLVAEYTGTDVVGTAVTQTGAKFTLVYNQK